jgi:hypothetical protein
VAPILQRMRLRPRVFAAIVGCMFLAQTTFVAAQVAALGEGVVFGAVCAPQDDVIGGETPLLPHHNRHCQGFCCILHDGALAAPPLRPVVSVAVGFPSEAVSPRLKTSGEAPRIEPRSSPQSPRAPPQQG